ncbi:MAG: hypothetical protein SGBAC_008887 [Bacillariaceae sp.]
MKLSPLYLCILGFNILGLGSLLIPAKATGDHWICQYGESKCKSTSEIESFLRADPNDGSHLGQCLEPSNAPTLSPTSLKPTKDSKAQGDPHFVTWLGEHFEFHGQCDILYAFVKNFANRDIDLSVHVRTKMVRFWSYIEKAVIRIGDDILEVEASFDLENDKANSHYKINFEDQGPLTDLASYPVTINNNNDLYTIDLSNAYAGLKIEINTFREFVGVKVVGATEESFGSSVGITGNFTNGNTLARDGATVIDDFTQLGLEWQVVPSLDGVLFKEPSKPQYPELCFLPENPRGKPIRRRLAEASITEEQAQQACAGISNKSDRQDCIFDVMNTQDLDMVGSYRQEDNGDQQSCVSQIKCADNKVHVCHANEEENVYETLCLLETEVGPHLKQYENDSLGECTVSDSSPMVEEFLQTAHLSDEIAPISDTELDNETGVVMDYTVELNPRVVRLAFSNVTQTVTCEGNRLKVLFPHTVSLEEAQKMFPTEYLLIHEGEQCNLVDEEGGSPDWDPEIGAVFLEVQSVEVDGKLVTVSGEVGSFHYMFHQAEMNWTHTEEGQDGRRLKLGRFDVSEEWNESFEYSNDLPVKIAGSVRAGFEGSSNGLYYYIKPWKRRGGLSYEADFRAYADVNVSIAGKGEIDILKDDFQFDFVTVPIVGMTFKFPRTIAWAIRKFLIRGFSRNQFLGLALDIPLRLEYDAGLTYDVALTASSSFDTGVQEIKYELGGKLKKLNSNFEYKKDGNGYFNGLDYNVDALDIELCLDLAFGPRPELALSVVGLAEAGIGIYCPITIQACVGTEPQPPVRDSKALFIKNCKDNCWRGAVDIGIAIRDAYVRTRLLNEKETETPILEKFSEDLLIGKFCFLESEKATCGETCCGFGDQCVRGDQVLNPNADPYCMNDGAPTISTLPSAMPSSRPSLRPSLKPSALPSSEPLPTLEPTSAGLTTAPTSDPSLIPNCVGKMEAQDACDDSDSNYFKTMKCKHNADKMICEIETCSSTSWNRDLIVRIDGQEKRRIELAPRIVKVRKLKRTLLWKDWDTFYSTDPKSVSPTKFVFELPVWPFPDIQNTNVRAYLNDGPDDRIPNSGEVTFDTCLVP